MSLHIYQQERIAIIKKYLLDKKKVEWVKTINDLEEVVMGVLEKKIESVIPEMTLSEFLFDEINRKWSVTRDMLMGKRRYPNIVDCRKIFCFCMKRYCATGPTELGRYLGDRDHGTICYTLKSAEDLFTFNAEFRDKLSFMITNIDINFQKP